MLNVALCRAFLAIRDPVRVRFERSAPLFAVREALITPQVHDLILRADFGDEVADEVGLMALLYRQAFRFVELEEGLEPARNHGVGAQVHDHRPTPGRANVPRVYCSKWPPA